VERRLDSTKGTKRRERKRKRGEVVTSPRSLPEGEEDLEDTGRRLPLGEALLR